MRRARLIPAFALLAAVALAAPAGAIDVSTHVNGVGMVDYSTGKPDFHVGSWARYHVTAKSELGMSDDYIVTVLIAGEEEFWGDRGFWVETWTEIPGHGTSTTATLMSYSIFGDTLALPHLQVYMRKTIVAVNEDGSVEENLYERAETSMQSRTPVGGQVLWNWVPLGRDTVVTPKGTFDCEKKLHIWLPSPKAELSAHYIECTQNALQNIGLAARVESWLLSLPVLGRWRYFW